MFLALEQVLSIASDVIFIRFVDGNYNSISSTVSSRFVSVAPMVQNILQVLSLVCILVVWQRDHAIGGFPGRDHAIGVFPGRDHQHGVKYEG